VTGVKVEGAGMLQRRPGDARPGDALVALAVLRDKVDLVAQHGKRQSAVTQFDEVT
jgi:hypothetical protein